MTPRPAQPPPFTPTAVRESDRTKRYLSAHLVPARIEETLRRMAEQSDRGQS